MPGPLSTFQPQSRVRLECIGEKYHGLTVTVVSENLVTIPRAPLDSDLQKNVWRPPNHRILVVDDNWRVLAIPSATFAWEGSD